MKLYPILLPLIFSILTVYISCGKDEVMNLPNYPFNGKMYSGYLNILNPKKKLHYLFIESGNDPANDPLVLWLNGGPGCSSLLGWAQEHGPAMMEEASDKFNLNPYSWHKAANMIYLESPAGVGFSYVDSTKPEDLAMNDEISGRENLQALLDFFKRYPSFRNNDLYISGESYAGIYVPTLASNILDYNQRQVTSKQIRLKGIIVGNGVTDWNVDTENALLDFAFTHALYSPELRRDYTDNCKINYKEEPCKEIKDKIGSSLGSVNIYDIYRKCFKPTPTSLSSGKTYNYTPWLFRNAKHNKNNPRNFLTYLEDDKKEINLKLTPPCVDSIGPDRFFNNPAVKLALNVRTDITWEMCSKPVGDVYEVNPNGSFYLYPKLINSGLRILIYSGDTDGAVPYTGTQKWISNLNLNVASPWKSWRVDSAQIAGYRTIYEGLTFVTVKGTGHMVPQWKPKEAFHMFTSFLAGKDL